MVDIGHLMNSIVVCIVEVASKITRSMSSSLKLLQSKQAAERNSTSEREALSEKPEEDAMKPLSTRDSNEASLYSAGVSPPGGFWSDNDGAHLAEGRVHRVTYLHRYRAFFYCFITAFIASIFIVSSLRWWLWTLGMFCIMGAFGAARSCWTLAISALFARGGGKKVAFDADELRRTSRTYLLVLVTLAASITYEAGLKPPGGLWQENATDGHHYGASDPVLQTTYPRRYLVFFYCNAPAFVACQVSLVLLLSNICRTRGIKSCALQVAMIIVGLIGAFATGSCRGGYFRYTALLWYLQMTVHPNRPVKRNNQREATWHVASAAPHHMTGNQSLLLACVHNGDDGEGIVVHRAAKGEVPLRVQGSGSVCTESITLDDVWYVPGLDSNLVSTGQLARQGCAINLGPGGCRITRGGVLLGTARFTEACQFELDFLKVAASST